MNKIRRLEIPMSLQNTSIPRASKDGLAVVFPREVAKSTSLPQPIPESDRIGALPPESTVTAVTVEEPLPFLMAAMVLWGFGCTAIVLIPMAVTAMFTSPLVMASYIFRRQV